MPIKPENKALYPPNWKEIRQSILERACHHCEECQAPNHSVGARDRFGDFHLEDDIHNMNSDVGEHYFGEFPKMIKIILTIAHLDHDPTNNEPANLKALCQKCHNRYDAEHRKQTRRATLAARKQTARTKYATDPQQALQQGFFFAVEKLPLSVEKDEENV